ncbi:MAG: hypothetical protein V1918_09470 [Planctomycetota bacterium]
MGSTRNLAITAAALVLGGCSFLTMEFPAATGPDGETRETLFTITAVAPSDSATGESAGAADGASGIPEKSEAILHAAGAAAGAAALVPGPQQPIAAILATLLGAAGTILGWIVAFRRGRKVEVTTAALDSVLKGVNEIAGIGAKIRSATQEAGTSEIVESRYQAAVAKEQT